MGIRSKFVLCLLAVMLPVAAVGIFASHLLYKQLEESSTSFLLSTERLESARIEQALSEHAKDNRTLAANFSLREALLLIPVAPSRDYSLAVSGEATALPAEAIAGGPKCSLELLSETLSPITQTLQREATTLASSIVEIQVVNRLGQMLSATEGFSWMPVDDELIMRSMSNVKTLFGEAFVNPQGEQHLITVSPVISQSGTVLGAIVTEALLGPIIDTVGRYETIGQSVEVHLAQPAPDGGAQFITPLRFAPHAAFTKTVNSAAHTPIIQALHSPETRVFQSSDYRGVDSYFAIKTIDRVGWGLAIKIDVAEAQAPAQQLRTWLLLATLASIGFIILTYTCLLVPVVNRLDKAAQAARQIMNGDLSARLSDNSNDEISELTYSINSLASDLRADQQLRSEVETQLRFQASHDDLTGLFNRKHANTVIAELSQDARQQHSVMFLDLNGFKGINDRFGHAVGDTVLSLIARRLSDYVPPHATVARWGGDEFVVILPGTSKAQTSDLARTLRKTVFDRAISTNEAQHSVSCSIGLATSGVNKTLEEALTEADTLMYEQKKRHCAQKNRNSLADRNLRQAIKENRVEMRFQPIVRRIETDHFASVGADTRLFVRNNQRGYLISEKQSQEILSTTGLQELDELNLTLALNSLHRWNHAGIVGDDFRLAIRLSAQTLSDTAFPLSLENRLEQLHVRPQQLQLEVAANIDNISNLIVKDLQAIGISLGVNIAQCDSPVLRRLCLDNQPTACILGRAEQIRGSELSDIARYCDGRDISLLVRGIDSRKTYDELHDQGPSQFQGRLFGSAMKAVDFIGSLSATPAHKASARSHTMDLEDAC